MLKNVWVFDGPDWVVFPCTKVPGGDEDPTAKKLIQRSLEITFSGQKDVKITDLGIRSGESKRGDRGWMIWEWKVEVPGKAPQVCSFGTYNIYDRPDHL